MKTLILHRTPDGWLSLFPTKDSVPEEFEYDPNAPCICCGLRVGDPSMGGTAICSWCDCGVDRSGNKVLRHHGPGNPHPKYKEFYGL